MLSHILLLLDQSASTTPGAKTATIPIPPSVSKPTQAQPNNHSPYLSNTTHLSYTSQSLQQAMVLQVSHLARTQSTIMPPTIINPQQPVTQLGTPLLAAYQSIQQTHQPNAFLPQSVPSTGNRYHQNALQMQHASGIPHLSQMGGINPHYNSGMNPSIPMAASIPRQQQQQQQQQMFPSSTVLPPSSLHTPPPPSHHHQPYHTNSGTWR